MARIRIGDTVFIDGRGFSIAPSLDPQPIPLKRPTFVSGGGGRRPSPQPKPRLPMSTLETPTKPAQVQTRTTGVVSGVQTVSLADIRNANLKTAQKNALIRLKQRGQLNLIPISKTLEVIERARQRREGAEVIIQTIAKEQQKIKREKEKRQLEGKASPGRDIGVNALGVVKTGLKLAKTTQGIVAGIPSFAQKGVGFVSNKPFKRIEESLRNLTYATIISEVKISRRKFISQLKTNPGEALSQAVADYYLIGGRGKTIKKAFSYEAPTVAIRDKAMKGIYLKVKKGERPVLFKYKRGEGVRIKDVQARISSRMRDLRKGKKLEITSKTLKPVVIDLGKVKPRVPKPKPPKAPRPTRKGGVSLPPKTVPPKIKKTVLKTEAGDKITIIKDISKIKKQANKRIADLRRDLKRRSIKVKGGVVSEINAQAIINLRQRIKVQALRKRQADKLTKSIRSRKKKLSKLELKKLGFKVKELSARQQRLAKKRGKKFLEKETKVLRKKTKKELEEEARIRARILKARKGKAKLKGLKVKKLTPAQKKKAVVRGKKIESKLTKAQMKKDQVKLRKEILEARSRTFKIQKQKVSNIQNVALKRFKEQNKRQLKTVSTKADAVRVIETNINQMKRTAQQGQRISQQLKQVQLPKTAQKQVRQKVFIVNDKLVQAQKRLNALKKKKNVSQSKLIQEVKMVQKLKNNMFVSIAGASGVALNTLQRKNIAERIKTSQRTRQREGQKQRPRETFVESTSISQAERELLKKIQRLRQRQILRPRPKPKQKPRRRIPKIRVEKRQVIRKKAPSKKDFLVYDVFGKSGNKFIKLNKKPIVKVDALARGSFAIDRSTARTFKIVPRGRSQKPGRILKREKGYYDKNKQKFRSFQIKKGKKKTLQQTKIERKGKPLIDTRGEVKGLTLAKLIKKNKYHK